MKKELMILLFSILSLSMQAQCELLYVSIPQLNVRENPSKVAKILSKLSFKEPVMVDSSTTQDGFVMVKSNDCTDTLGYVWASYLMQELPEELPTDLIEQVPAELPATTRTLPKRTNIYSSGATRSSSSRTRNNNGCGPGGVTLYRGPRGGCYYYSGRSKIYVTRSCCN